MWTIDTAKKRGVVGKGMWGEGRKEVEVEMRKSG